MENKNLQSQTNHNPSKTPASQGTGSQPTKSKPVDKVLFVSDDGLFLVKQLVDLAQRYPYSDYPCIVMQAFPAEHKRIRRIPGGGIELMLAHDEFEAVIDGINSVSESQGKEKLYNILKRVPPKTRAHKEWWQRFNERRHARKSSWWQGKRRN